MSTEHRHSKKYWLVAAVIVPLIVAIIEIIPHFFPNDTNNSSYQDWLIKGRILDNSTKLPIQEAKVSLEFDGIAKIQSTDSEGIYIFEIQVAGSKLVSRVTAEATGYKVYNRSLELISDATNIDDIVLVPLPAAAPPPSIITTSTPKPTPAITPAPTVIPTPTHDIALLIVNDDNTINWNISHKIAALLRKKGKSVTVPFSDSFVSEGSFEQIFQGNPKAADQAGLLRHGHYAVLGKITGSFVKQSEDLLNLITAKTGLEIHAVDSKTGIIANSVQFKANGVGGDKEKAQDLALQRILKDVEQKIEILLP